jgi:hypothetical protein
MHRHFVRAALAAGLAAAGIEGAWAEGFALEVGPTILIRDPGVDTTMFRESDPNQAPILTSTLMDVLVSTGAVATLTAGGPFVGVELRGILVEPGTSHWFENVAPVSLLSAGIVFGAADAFGIIGGITTLDLTADRSSYFRSLEASLRVGAETFGFFAGMRQIMVNDHLQLVMDAAPSGLPGSTNTADINVRNMLLGPQIGAELNLTLVRWATLSGFIKAGMMRNEMSADFALTGTGNFTTSTAWTDQSSEWTMAVEAGLDVTLNISPNLGIFAGASILQISEVASSTRTLPSLDLGGGNGGMDLEPALYLGARAGIRLSF